MKSEQTQGPTQAAPTQPTPPQEPLRRLPPADLRRAAGGAAGDYADWQTNFGRTS